MKISLPLVLLVPALLAGGCQGCLTDPLQDADAGQSTTDAGQLVRADGGQASSGSSSGGASSGGSSAASSSGGASTSASGGSGASSSASASGVASSSAAASSSSGGAPDAGTTSCTSGCGTWRKLTDLPGGRNRHTATLLNNGKVLIAGGDDATGSAMRSCLLFDPTTEMFTATGDLATGRYTHTATLMNDGRVLVAGGVGVTTGGFGTLGSAEIYDPGTGTWSTTDELVAPRSAHTAYLLPDGKVGVLGGLGSTDYPVGVEAWNPTTQMWVAAGTLQQPRYVNAGAPLPNGRFLIAGGRHIATLLSSAEIHDRVVSNTTGALPETMQSARASALMDGRVLLTGGNRGPGPLGNGYIFDPTGGTWGTAIALVTPRHAHESVTLQDGRVFLMGGSGGSSAGALSACELFNPTTSQFTDAAWMNDARIGFTATVLQNGNVLVVGGTRNFDLLSGVELWTPG